MFSLYSVCLVWFYSLIGGSELAWKVLFGLKLFDDYEIYWVFSVVSYSSVMNNLVIFGNLLNLRS